MPPLMFMVFVAILTRLKNLLKNLSIHILALNETKLDGLVPKELIDILGHQQFCLDRTSNGRGDVPSDDLELLCIETEPSKSEPFLVVSCQ